MIRKAEKKEIERILEIYSAARLFMRQNGNKKQWINGYPGKEMLLSDIEKEQLFVFEENGEIHAVFAFILGDDPTYSVIEYGEWLSDEEYGTIHRIASDGKIRGMLQSAVEYCSAVINHLRIDTHADNFIMQNAVEKAGFKKCGVIYLEDGSPRIAYEKTR